MTKQYSDIKCSLFFFLFFSFLLVRGIFFSLQRPRLDAFIAESSFYNDPEMSLSSDGVMDRVVFQDAFFASVDYLSLIMEGNC